MAARYRSAYFAIYLIVIAPAATIVIISALLLFGVRPSLVFAPGLAMRALIHGPRAVAVAGTAFVYWLVLALIGFIRERYRS